MSHTYKATATREGDWWIITIPELDAVTQARKVSEIDTMAVGLVTALLDLEDGEAVVKVEVKLPAAVTDDLAKAEKLQLQAESDSRRAAELRRHAVQALLTEGSLSKKEAGELLGVSYQRIQQLAKSA